MIHVSFTGPFCNKMWFVQLWVLSMRQKLYSYLQDQFQLIKPLLDLFLYHLQREWYSSQVNTSTPLYCTIHKILDRQSITFKFQVTRKETRPRNPDSHLCLFNWHSTMAVIPAQLLMNQSFRNNLYNDHHLALLSLMKSSQSSCKRNEELRSNCPCKKSI